MHTSLKPTIDSVFSYSNICLGDGGFGQASAFKGKANVRTVKKMKGATRLLALFALAFSLSAFPLNLTIKALVPTAKSWYWITNRGVVIAEGPPERLKGTWNVKEISKNVFVLAGKVDACKVEALALTSIPKPVVYKNSTISIECGQRYLYSDLVKAVRKGKGIVVIYPLPGETCKEINFNARVLNETLVLNITIKKIKNWLDICPPSKLVDVIVAWGDAKAVKVYVNGKETLVS